MKHMEIFSDISYLALEEMAHRNIGAVGEESDDERNCVNEEENKEEDDEFSTYFSDNRVHIPEDDKVKFDQITIE